MKYVTVTYDVNFGDFRRLAVIAASVPVTLGRFVRLVIRNVVAGTICPWLTRRLLVLVAPLIGR